MMVERALLDFFVNVRNAIDRLLQQYAPKTIDEVKNKIPKELNELLAFEESEHYFILKPRQYLGAENFAKILDAVRELGGGYVSRGKDSHFRVLKGA